VKDRYVTAIAIIAFAAGAVLAGFSIRSQPTFCPQQRAASVGAFFAPCQALNGAVGPRLAGSEDPFLHPNGG
jgi:hypothetical protein